MDDEVVVGSGGVVVAVVVFGIDVDSDIAVVEGDEMVGVVTDVAT